MDGSVARHRGESGRSGAFMDSVLDRISDMVLFSCLFWRLAADGQTIAAVLALITLVVSVAVSHVRAEAEAAKVVLTEGLFQRLERVIALAVGLLDPRDDAAGAPAPRGARHRDGAATRRSWRCAGREPAASTSASARSQRSPRGRSGRSTCPPGASGSRTTSGVCSRSPRSAPANGCALAEGTFDDRSAQVTCASCDSVFDLETGEPVDGPARDPLPLYSAREVDGWIEVSAAPVA